MRKEYKGAYERTVDRMIQEHEKQIEINWINMSAKETGSGGADRITKKLIRVGYRPDGAVCVEKARAAYESGQKIDGRYIRFPQEIWIKSA